MMLGTDAILPDTPASVTGVIIFSSTEPAVMNAALLILDLDDTDPVPLRGEITEVILEPGEDECHITLDDGAGETGVGVSDRTIIFLIEDGESSIGSLEDLMPGDTADVYGRADDAGGCFKARVIIAFPQPAPVPMPSS